MSEPTWKERVFEGGLAPCPFCRTDLSRPEIVHGMQDGWVQCQTCGASGPRRSSDEDAAKAWNTQPALSDLQARKEV